MQREHMCCAGAHHRCVVLSRAHSVHSPFRIEKYIDCLWYVLRAHTAKFSLYSTTRTKAMSINHKTQYSARNVRAVALLKSVAHYHRNK